MLQNGDPKAVKRKLQVPAKARGRGRNHDPAGETTGPAKRHPDQDRALFDPLFKVTPGAGDRGFPTRAVDTQRLDDRLNFSTRLMLLKNIPIYYGR